LEEISAVEAISASNTFHESFGIRERAPSVNMAASAPSFGAQTHNDFD